MNIRRLQNGCTWKTLFIPFLTRNLMSDEGVELYIARGVEVQCNLGGEGGGALFPNMEVVNEFNAVSKVGYGSYGNSVTLHL